MRLKHLALHVPDLERAEAFYRRALGMEVVSRERLESDGVWRQLPHDVGWDRARAVGVEIHMVALRRADLLVALFTGAPQPGTVFLIGVVADPDQIAAVRTTLPSDARVETDRSDAFTFVDPFGFRWQLSGPAWQGPGDARGDWVDLSD